MSLRRNLLEKQWGASDCVIVRNQEALMMRHGSFLCKNNFCSLNKSCIVKSRYVKFTRHKIFDILVFLAVLLKSFIRRRNPNIIF